MREGRVQVNGEVVSDVGTLIDEENDVVKVEGVVAKPQRQKIYVAAYKPRDFVVTRSDPEGRPTVFDALKDLPRDIFPIGRLDKDSEGLILLTNDGKLAHRLAHPRYQVERVYLVEVQGRITDETLERLMGGIVIETGLARAKSVRLMEADEVSSLLKITLTEGKKREIRQMLETCGHRVKSLRRIRFGSVSLGDLAPGKWRYLTRDELRGLRRIVEEAYLEKLKE